MSDRKDGHVVVVNDRAFPGGGASKVALQSAAGLARRGWRVTLFAAMGPVAPWLQEAGVEVVLLGQQDLASGRRSKTFVQGLWNRTAGERLEALLKPEPGGRTLVHVHSWSKALSPSVFAAAAGSHPVAATLHDYGIACPNAGFHDFPTGQPCLRRPLSAACVTRNCDSRHYAHKVWRLGRQLSLHWLARIPARLDLAICVSDYSRDVLQPFLPKDLSVAVVTNPITAVDEGPASPAQRRDFVYVGRLSHEKGVLLLADAARRAGLPVVFVGDGELADEIRRRNPDASLTGWVEADEVRRRMREARAVVMPPTWRETQGMVVPEAFSCGVPVVASSGTAPGAAVRDGVTGIVFANGDVESLAGALRRLAADDALVARLGRAAYDGYWAKPADMDGHLDQLEAVYRRLLSGLRSPSSSAVAG